MQKRIIELKAGEGGDHARNLAARLTKAYTRWIEKTG
jgi:protein subunit release factor B